jgi:hypothetical protein
MSHNTQRPLPPRPQTRLAASTKPVPASCRNMHKVMQRSVRVLEGLCYFQNANDRFRTLHLICELTRSSPRGSAFAMTCVSSNVCLQIPAKYIALVYSFRELTLK